MRHGTHEVIGFSLALVAGRVAKLDALETVVVAVAAVYGSWLPDADRLGSRVHRRSALERRSLVARGVGTLLRLPLWLVGLVASHRGVSHSLLACAAIGVLTGLLLLPLSGVVAGLVGGGIALGYGAHVAADACTPSGVRLWLPVSRRCVWLLPSSARIPTGSLRERAVAVLVVGLAAAVLLR